AAQADLSAQEAAARAVVLSLVSDVASGYLQLLELDQERAVAERTLATRGVTLDLARQRYARGVISELDVRQFEAQVAVPAARLAQVEQQRAQEEHALNVLLGAAPATMARAARARAEEARAAYEQTALTALREAGDALAGVRAARDQVAAQDTQAKALRRALQLAEARYQAGVASYLEVLDSQRSLFDAELAVSQAQLLQLTAAVQLYKALGGSWSGDGEGAETR